LLAGLRLPGDDEEISPFRESFVGDPGERSGRKAHRAEEIEETVRSPGRIGPDEMPSESLAGHETQWIMTKLPRTTDLYHPLRHRAQL